MTDVMAFYVNKADRVQSTVNSLSSTLKQLDERIAELTQMINAKENIQKAIRMRNKFLELREETVGLLVESKNMHNKLCQLIKKIDGLDGEEQRRKIIELTDKLFFE